MGPKEDQPTPEVTPPPPLLIHRAYNNIFGGRRKRRALFRRWLKRNRVPKPVFKTVSEGLTFKRLLAADFIQEVMQTIKAEQEKRAAAEAAAKAKPE